MKEYFELAAVSVEVAGVSILLVGLLVALARFVGAWRSGFGRAYKGLRLGIGRALLLALEFLVAADIIYTVAVDPSLESLGLLGLLVLIRTFLSFTLELEVTGRWPWQDGEERRASK